MYKIKKGLDLPISGVPSTEIENSSKISSVAILGSDYIGLKPTMMVKLGDDVKTGQKVIEDKKNPGIFVTSPTCGVISAINRGEKRVLLSVVIDVEDLNDKGVSITKLHSKEKSKKDFTKKCCSLPTDPARL